MVVSVGVALSAVESLKAEQYLLLARTAASVRTDFLDLDGLNFSPYPPEADQVDSSGPAPGPQEGDRPVRPLPDRPGVYRQLFLTVWRGESGGDSTFRFAAQTVRFCVGQRERCPSTGRVHEHYWICFLRPVRIRTAERLFEPELEKGDYDGGRPWGTNAQVHRYCTKVCATLDLSS